METKATEYILEISKQKSITKAANMLGISQSALSQILLRIEREVGAPLFIRRKRALAPTEAGCLYIDAAQKIVDTRNKLCADIKDLSSVKRIRLGLTSRWGMLMMLQILPVFHKKFPDILIELRQHNYQTLMDKYNQFTVDLAVTTLSARDTLPENCTILREEEMRLIVNSSHPFSVAHKDENELPEIIIKRELEGLSIIRSAIGSTSRVLEDELFGRISFIPRAFCEVTDYITFVNFVEANLGFAFISSDYINTSSMIRSWRLSPRLVRNNALLIRPGLEINGSVQQLIELIGSYKFVSYDK